MGNIIRVAIIGGTHGNELTGIHLIRKWRMNGVEVSRPTFQTSLFLGNPKAIGENRRFIDEDLNRCFSVEALKSIEPASYEASRAQVLNGVIGPKESPKYDFVIDLHTSTSNCGAMIILFDLNPFNVALAAYLSNSISSARVYYIPAVGVDQPYLNSICKRGLAVEVGPIPQGLLRSDTCALSTTMVTLALDFADSMNRGEPIMVPESIEIFRFIEAIYFPRNGSDFNAVVHKDLQDRDFYPMKAGDPMFQTLEGKVMYYEGSDTVYPVFINEAAYYYKGIAMSLTVKERIPVASDYHA